MSKFDNRHDYHINKANPRLPFCSRGFSFFDMLNAVLICLF